MTKLKFKEINESFTLEEALKEAKRCLNCKNPQCKTGCPIDNDIPGFIHQLSMGNMGAAMSIINERSNLPAICGRVCPHENQCEGHCILSNKGKGLKIGKLERFVADFDTDMRLIRERLPRKVRGKIAVIGSGPAGLTVAGDLARQGFSVTILERESKAGGVLMYGIPQYRLPKEVVQKEIEKIEELGVNFITDCVVGVNVTIDELFSKGYDAIFIGSGTALPQTLNIPGNTLRGVVQSVHVLHMSTIYNAGLVKRDAIPVHVGETVGVIGCGNVAIDGARTALRMGASKVDIIYRKTINEMPALMSEYEAAVLEGVNFLWQYTPVEFIGNEDNRLVALKVNTKEGDKTLPYDRILLAVGSRPADRIVSTTTGIEVDEKGYVKTKERPYGMTSRRGVFAGGDVVHRPQTVVLAMKEAKKVASGIAQYVDAIKLIEETGGL